jgi:O-antigen ligase
VIRRASAAIFSAGLLAFAATSAFSITVATIALLLALGGALGLAWVRESSPVDRRVALAVGIYLALKLITVFAATDVPHSLREFAEYWPYLLLLALPFATKSGPRPVVLLRVLAVTFAVTSLYAVWQHFVGLDYVRDRMLVKLYSGYRATAFFDHHLTWGGYALFATLLFAGLRLPDRKDRILFGAVAALGLLGVFATYGRGPAVGVAAGLVLYLLMRHSGWKIVGAAAVVTALALLVTPDLFLRFEAGAAMDLNPKASASRTGIWLSAWAIGKAHPLTGVGPGNFGPAFDRYKASPNLRHVDHAHDQWLDEWATSGVLGVAGFCLLLGTVAFALWGRRRQAGGLPAAALAAWCGLATAALFECHFSDAEILMLAVYCVGLGLLPGPESAEIEERD